MKPSPPAFLSPVTKIVSPTTSAYVYQIDNLSYAGASTELPPIKKESIPAWAVAGGLAFFSYFILKSKRRKR